MPAALPVDLREAAKALILSGKTPKETALELGISHDVVCQWSSRYRWISRTPQRVERAMGTVMIDSVSAHSKRVRMALAMSVSRQAQALIDAETTLEEMRNNPNRQGLSAVTKTVTETASEIFGWSKDSPAGLLSSLDLDSVIDVEEVPAPTQPADTTTELLD